MVETKHEFYDETEISGESFFGATWRAQTFTVGTVGANENFDITKVVLRLARTGFFGFPGTLTVAIKAVDGDHKPTGPDLSTGTTDADSFGTKDVAAWHDIEMSTFTIQASTEYAIICKALDGGSFDSVLWYHRNSAPLYSGGVFVTSIDSGSSWFTPATNIDRLFEVWGEAAAPTGTNLQINIGDVWKEVPAVQINIGDVWKEVTGMQINIGDSWKTIF